MLQRKVYIEHGSWFPFYCLLFKCKRDLIIQDRIFRSWYDVKCVTKVKCLYFFKLTAPHTLTSIECLWVCKLLSKKLSWDATQKWKIVTHLFTNKWFRWKMLYWIVCHNMQNEIILCLYVIAVKTLSSQLIVSHSMVFTASIWKMNVSSFVSKR